MNAARLTDSPPGRLFVKVQEDNAFNWAIILAWNTLTNLFPLVLVAAAVLALALGAVGVNSQGIYGTILHILPSDGNARTDAMNALNSFHQRSGIFFVVGFVGLMWTATGLFRSMEQAFCVIYHTKQRPMLRGVLMSMVMMLVFIGLVGLIVVTSTYLGFLSGLAYLPSALTRNGIFAFAVQFLIGALSGFALFLTLYYVVPNRRLSYHKVWPGALLAGIAFEGLSLLFPLYVRLTGGGSAYGKTFGLIFLLMAFFYFLGLITMFGVELNSLLSPVPVEQPEGRESLQTPIQGEPRTAAVIVSDRALAPAQSRTPVAAVPERKPSRVKGVLALVVMALIGVLRGGRKRRIA